MAGKVQWGATSHNNAAILTTILTIGNEEIPMRATTLLCVSATVMSFLSPAFAEDEPKGFKCSFEAGASWSYDGGAFKNKAPAPLTFEITEIDLEGQSAKLIAAEGEKPGPLKIVRAINANHYLEVVNEGFLNLTTVYDTDPATGRHPAVHSRHLGVLGQPVFAQYAGFCAEK